MGWKILKNQIYPIGIDVGSTAVRMLQLRQGNAGWHVIAAASQEYDQSLTDLEPTAKERAIYDAVRLAKAKAPFEGSDCISCLSTSDMLLRAARLPKMSDGELDKAAAWEAADRFDQPVEDLQTIWIRAGAIEQGKEKQDEIILVSVPRQQVELHLEALIANHLRPIAVDASFAAVTRATCRTLRREADLSTAQMIIDIGADVSSVILTRGNQFAFLKTIRVGGTILNADVARALNMTEAEATDLRRRRMIPLEDSEQVTDPRVDRAVFEAVRPHIHDLAQEAALCLRYYSVTFRGVRPNVVKITGADAAEPNLAEVLADHLKIPTEVARPFEGIEISKTNLAGERRAAHHADWCTAFGLSLRGTEGTLVGRRTRPPADPTEINQKRQNAA